jgi:hypothetical protein
VLVQALVQSARARICAPGAKFRPAPAVAQAIEGVVADAREYLAAPLAQSAEADLREAFARLGSVESG